MSLAAAFQALINPDWELARTDSFWQLQEPTSPHSLLEIGGSKSYAFSLDHKEGKERKGTTRRSAELPEPETCCYGYPVFTLANHPRVFLPDLIHKLGSGA
ncbi:hypothetical protein [uncultured Thiodictyon sp.]|uniref:hypothetical protein n=1 Tax=uncultured Thiodictyon sp. TaxID=1846217 RepID=UPI0025EEB778|nr:hypothetical protein [uncultured Thiodictyon sp.]